MMYDEMILGEDAIFSMDVSKTQLNNNVLVCGCSGCGKTMSISEPMLLSTRHSSLVVTLSKRRLVRDYAGLFRRRGYHVMDMNFVSPEKSKIAYDPLQYVRSWMDVTYLAKAIVMADPQKKNSLADPYWDNVSVSLLSALISHVLMTKKKGTMADVVELFRSMQLLKSDGLVETSLDGDFEVIRKADPRCFAISCWDSFRQTPIRTAGCIYSTLGAAVDAIFTPSLCQMIRAAEKIDFRKLSREKTVLFITTSPVNPALNSFANIFYGQMFKELFEIGERNESGQLERPVKVLCDDFACGARILNFAEYISIFREKGISVMMMLQSESQLKSIYGENDAKTIINNSDTYIYLGGIDLDTARSVSQRLNQPLEDVLSMPIGRECIFRRGQKPMVTRRYNILENKEYQKLMESCKAASIEKSEKGLLCRTQECKSAERSEHGSRMEGRL